MIDVNCKAGGRHELEYWPDYDMDEYGCKHCLETFPANTVVGLLNAAMQLTADEAETIVLHYMQPRTEEWERMRAFASRWRGDTEESEDE